VKSLPIYSVLAVLLIAVIVPAGRAQGYAHHEAVGNLAGTVLDAHGRPVADASVTIQTSDGNQPHATRTDSKGRFAFDRWATGQYDLRAYANGAFSDWDQRVEIRSKKTTEVTLRLDAR